MEKCDVIPRWMFTHLMNSGKEILRQEKYRLEEEKREMLKKVKKKVISKILDKRIAECFHINRDPSGDTPRYWIDMNSSMASELENDYLQQSKLIKEKFKKKIEDLMMKYQKWENRLLTGKVKRSEADKFKV